MKQGKITVRIDSSLNKYIINNNPNREVICSCPIKVKDVLRQLAINTNDIGFITRNCSIISIDTDLNDNDLIILFPLMEGG